MKPTRTTQPYRSGARAPGAALNAMLKGRTSGGFNPQDAARAAQLMSRASRSARKPRPSRPPRPSR